MRLHKGIPACSLATVLAVLMLAPVASTTAAEVIEVQEECVPFRIAGNVFHQRCTSYVVYDNGGPTVAMPWSR